MLIAIIRASFGKNVCANSVQCQVHVQMLCKLETLAGIFANGVQTIPNLCIGFVGPLTERAKRPPPGKCRARLCIVASDRQKLIAYFSRRGHSNGIPPYLLFER